MKLNEDKFRETHGYEEGSIDVIDAESSAIAASYKKNFLKEFISINPQQIDLRLGGDRYYVTRKYDGEYAIIFHQDQETVTINRSGRVRRGIPCIEEAGKLLSAAGFLQAVVPAEIYVGNGKRKVRVNDLVAALADEKKTSTLKLAVFDILQLDNQPYKPADYQETIRKLGEIFNGGKRVHPVDYMLAKTNDEVKSIYSQWVEKQGSEGIVVRSDLPFVFKIKPRHSLDTVVVGFTEGTGSQKGQVRTILLAMMPEANKYQVVGRVGGGMPTELKKKLFKEFSSAIIRSEFIDTDSNHVAFRMIEPKVVLEVTVNDLVYESSSSEPIMNTMLEVVDGKYTVHSSVEGFSFIAPLFGRVRDDKTADADDVRLAQTEVFSQPGEPPKPTPAPTKKAAMQKSELLMRQVYKKELGSKIMVQKFLVWKTNKEASGEYPAYVFCYVNFSSERKEPLQREVKISDDYDQIMQLAFDSQEENIKKGWFIVE